MLKKTVLARSVALAFGGVSMFAGTATLAQQTQDLQRVEVTGSSIKRTDVEGPAPVDIITRKDIEKTGATNITDLVRSIPAIDLNDQGGLASNSPSGSGSSTLRLRGLGESNLLILLNGRRLPVNALYDSSGAGAAFDVNTIPISAIERIEILKDGGSAIYGADAVAGVFNIITKTDYQGLEALGGYGVSSRHDGRERHAVLTGGFGDLTKDRFNVLASVDVFNRDPILRSARAITSSADQTANGGGDGRSGFSPTGNVIDPVTGGYAGPYKPCPAGSLDAGNVCRYDFNKSILTSYNGADRISGLTIGTFQLTPDIKLFGEIVYSYSKDHFEAQPVPDYFVVAPVDPSQVQYEFAPGQIYIAGRFMQGGPRITDRKSSLFNTVVGAEGTTNKIDWKVSVGQGVSRVSNQDHNYYDKTAFDNDAGSGLIDPTVTTNDPALVDSLKVSPKRVGKSVDQYINAQISGDLYQLPAGMLRYAVGAQYLRETLTDTPDPILVAGNVLGDIQQSGVDTSRNSKAIFGELSIPVLTNLEGQAAARYDKYPGASQTSPKVGLKYTVIPELAFRASYTKSFRVPDLKQLYGAQEQGATDITDPNDCAKLQGVPVEQAACPISAYQVQGGNPNLKPEKGTTWNLGTIFQATKYFSGSVDFWQVKKTDDITTPTISSAVQSGNFTRQGAQFLIFTNLQNFAELLNRGVDFDGRMRFPGTPVGTITLRNATTYYFKQENRDSSSSPYTDYNGTYALPRYRNTFTATDEFGPWTVSTAVRTIGSFYDTDQGIPYAIDNNVRSVASDTEMDIQGQYTGFKGFTLTAGIRNMWDKMPPFSNQNLTNNSYTQLGFAELYSARGRFFYVTAGYKFF
jgi:iron complex outermembrane receptor protein